MIYRSPLPEVSIPEVPLPQFVLQRAAERGDKPAFIDGTSGCTLTYAELADGVKRVASSLAKRGFKKGDVFAVYSPNTVEYAVVFQAVASLGGVITTVNPLYTSHELTHQLTDAGARFLITVLAFLDKVKEAAERVGLEEIFVFGEAEGATAYAELLKGDPSPPEVAIDPREDLVVLPYSSGTTGLPKGVMLTHYNLVANLEQIDGYQKATRRPLSEDDVLLGLLPFYHIYGMTVIMNYALLIGATVVVMPRFDLEQFLDLIQKHRITYANVVPPIVLALAKHPLVDKYDLSSLRGVMSGAAPLGGDTAAAVSKRLGCEVTQGYGMTELSPVSHTNPDEPDTIDPSKVGPPIPNTECRIVDAGTGENLGPGEPGELFVRGPQVMKGYLNNPDATTATLDEGGWLRTGDIAIADERGYFAVIDRVKELIKYKGYQVAPAELEAVLISHPKIVDVAVIGVADEEAGEVPKAFIVAKGSLTEEEVTRFLEERVAPYKRVRAFEWVEEIPKSSSGKILRRVLVDREREAAGT